MNAAEKIRLNNLLAAEKENERNGCFDEAMEGNQKQMREALETILDRVNGLDEECGVDPVEIRDLARAALSAPPRNCDVGTAEEQFKRHERYCDAQRKSHTGYYGCSDVPQCQHCFAKWAQMPYAAKEGGAE